MEKFKSIIESETFIDVMIIIALMIVLTITSGFFAFSFLPDRGREFLFSEAVLNGLVPYKDITMIYFPLSYYINAFVFRLFGVSFNSLIIFAACFCTFFMIIYYLTAKEFLNRKIAIILSVFVILSCVFCLHDSNLYTSPYAFSRVYGIIGGVSCLFFLLKLFDTDNIKYGYLAALSASFSVSNRIEFVPVIVVLFLGFILYKRLKITEYIKLLLISMLFPFLTILFLVVGGVTYSDILSAIDFFIKFSSTQTMKTYLATCGVTPSFPAEYIIKGLPPLIITTLLCLLYCFLDKKYKNKIILPLMLIIAIPVCYFMRNTAYYWIELPLLTILFAIVFFKDIIKDKKMLLLLIAVMIFSQRSLFQLDLLKQGVYAFPLLIILSLTIIKDYISRYIPKIPVEKFIIFFFIVLIGAYSIQQAVRIKYVRYPLKTDKGTLYMTPGLVKIYGNTIKYIENNIPENVKLIVLPEGLMFNFITDRKTDMNCFIMDAPYYFAYGEKKALELIKNADFDYIIIADGFTLVLYGFDSLYAPNASIIADYIFQNYTKVYQEAEDNNPKNIITIYKKNGY